MQDPLPGDKADLVCIVLRNSFTVLFDAADASADFTKTIDLADLRSGTCLILAVPGRDRRRLRRPVAVHRADHHDGLARDLPHAAGDASGDVPYDFFFAQQQARGYGDYDGISSCGVCDTSLLFADTRRASEFMFFGNAFLDLEEPAPRVRSHLRIDGHNAYGSYVARLDLDPSGGYLAGSTLQGVPPIAASASGGRGEDLVIDEAEDLVRCQNGDTFPVTVLGCGRFVGTGVRVTRRIRQTRDGTLVHVVDVLPQRRRAAARARPALAERLPRPAGRRRAELPVPVGGRRLRDPGERAPAARAAGRAVHDLRAREPPRRGR